MEFVNETDFPAEIFTGFVGEDVIEAQFVMRATYRIGENGRLEKSDEQWPIFNEPLQTNLGSFPTDRQAPRRGCDVVVTGVVRRAEPIRATTVVLVLGEHRRELRVSGDRSWAGDIDALSPSEPALFSEMPLSWERAFGGPVELDGERGSHPLNGLGRGFYLSAESARGNPLPNIENPQALITNWSDQPAPACWASVGNPLGWYTVQAILESPGPPAPDFAERLAARAVYSACKPDMVLSDISDACRLTISGLTESQVSIELAGIVNPEVVARFGPDEAFSPCALSGLWLFLEQSLLVVTFRSLILGPYREREARTARMRLATET
jgi:Uncharacterized protein conserved in bacteria (DUF2169)